MTDEFLASLFGRLATEARETIQSVFQLIDLDARHPASSEHRVHLDACKESAGDLLRTIDDMRALFSEGAPLRASQRFDLSRCLIETVELLNLSSPSASGRLQLEVPDGSGIQLQSDQEAIEEIFARVLAATVNLTPAGVVRVGLEAGPRIAGINIRPPQAGVAWRVCRWLNTNPAETRFKNDLLLEVNGMVAGSRLRTLGGTAQLEAGQDGIEVLRILLPRPAEEPAPDATGCDQSRRTPLEVLLVEDCDDSFELVRELLPRERVARAVDGPEALEVVSRRRFDVIFMDIHLPGMDGYSVIRALREWETEQGHPRTPIVVLSADDLLTQQRCAAESGCSGYLRKPVRKADISDVLERLSAARG